MSFFFSCFLSLSLWGLGRGVPLTSGGGVVVVVVVVWFADAGVAVG